MASRLNDLGTATPRNATAVQAKGRAMSSGSATSRAERQNMAKPGWLFVLPWAMDLPGGVNTVVAGLYREAASCADYVPHLMVLDWTPQPAHHAGVDVPHSYARLRVPSQGRARIRQNLAFALALVPTLLHLWGRLRRSGIRVVNVHYVTMESLYFAILRRLGLIDRLVISLHGADAGNIGDGMLSRRLWRFVFHAADRVIVVSDALKSAYPARLWRDDRHVVTIHNGIDSDACRREALGDARPVRENYIVCAATLEHKKGVDVLIRAFARIAAAHEGVELRLVGHRTPYAAAIDRLIAELERDVPGFRGRVDCCGGMSHADALRMIAGARLMVLPSRSEPFGLVLLEAGCLSTPVIATTAGGIPEIIVTDRDGLLVAPEDIEGLARAIGALLDDPDRATAYAVSLQARVLRHFTWSIAWSRYREIVAPTPIGCSHA